MKCTNHPDVEATVQCSQCRKPLCASCANLDNGNNSYICHMCLAMKAAEDMIENEEEKRRYEQEQRAMARGKKKDIVFYKIAAAILILCIGAIINIILYFHNSSDVEKFTCEEHPLAAAIMIDSAIQDYAADHGGSFPAMLHDLIGEYLLSDEFNPDNFKKFIYTVTPSLTSYTLQIKNPDGEAGNYTDLIFSGGESPNAKTT